MNKRYIYEEQDDGYYFIKDTIKNNYLNVVTNVELLNKLTNNQNQKAIECLKEVREDISLMTDLSMIKETEHKTAILNFYKDIMQVINAIIDNKIKELEGENG